MTRLEIKLDGKDIGADKALLTARTTLKLLRAIEKERTGRRAATPWKVDIFSGFNEIIIVIHAEPSREKDGDVAFVTAEAMLANLRKP